MQRRKPFSTIGDGEAIRVGTAGPSKAWRPVCSPVARSQSCLLALKLTFSVASTQAGTSDRHGPNDQTSPRGAGSAARLSAAWQKTVCSLHALFIYAIAVSDFRELVHPRAQDTQRVREVAGFDCTLPQGLGAAL